MIIGGNLSCPLVSRSEDGSAGGGWGEFRLARAEAKSRRPAR